jgi:hypothetical protein
MSAAGDAGVVLTDAQKRMAKYQKLEKIGEGNTNSIDTLTTHPKCTFIVVLHMRYVCMLRYIWFGV